VIISSNNDPSVHITKVGNNTSVLDYEDQQFVLSLKAWLTGNGTLSSQVHILSRVSES